MLVFFFDLIPVVGATIAAFLVAIVVAFVNFPIALIIWVVFAIVYQQFENYVIQPQIQKRATEIEPFIILVAVLCGATLFGIIGALLAIPTAAAIQISVTEWREYRRSLITEGVSAGNQPPSPPRGRPRALRPPNSRRRRGGAAPSVAPSPVGAARRTSPGRGRAARPR